MARSNIQTRVETTVDGKQAKEELTLLAERAKKYRLEMEKANEANDGKAFRKAEKELKKTQKQMRDLERKSFDVNKVLANLSSSTIPELTKAQRELRAQMNKPGLSRTSKEYDILRTKMQAVNAEIAKVNAEQKIQPGLLDRSTNFWSKYSGVIMGAAAGFIALVVGLKKFRDEQNKIEDNALNLQALTGLDKESVDFLQKQAEQMATKVVDGNIRIRDSASEILDAYTIIGSNKPELLSDKDALLSVTKYALILKTASKDIKTTKEAADALALSLNQYGEGADQAERYTNALATSAQKGAANVASQTSALKNAGVALAGANVTFEESLGLIQTLAEKGIKDEMAGTGLKKLMLTLQTGADETNPKIHGLAKALENLASKQMTATDMKKMFGEEGYNVAKVIIDNTTKVNEYTAAITGTSTAMEMAATNSEGAAAKLAQYKNEITMTGIALINQLQPIIAISTSGFSYALKILPPVITFLKQYGAKIMLVAAAYAAYTIAARLQNAVTEEGLITKIKDLVVTKAKTVQNAVLTASVYAQSAAYAILHGNIKRGIQAMKLMLTTLGISPWGAAAIAVIALGAAIYKYATQSTEATKSAKLMNDIMKESAESIAKEKTEMEILMATAKNEKISKEQRIDAIKKLNEISPEYLGNLSLENINTGEATASVELYTKALEKNARAKAASSKMAELENEILKNEIEAKKLMDEYEAAQLRGGERKEYKRIKAEDIKKENEELKAQKKVILDIVQAETITKPVKTNVGLGGELIAAKANLAELKEKHRDLQEKLTKEPLNFVAKANVESIIKEIQAAEKKVEEIQIKMKQKPRDDDGNKTIESGGSVDLNSDSKKMMQKEIEYAEQVYRKEKNSQLLSLIQKKKTQEQHNNDMNLLDISLIDKKIEIQTKYNQDTSDLENQRIEKYIQAQKRLEEQRDIFDIKIEEEEPEEDAKWNSFINEFTRSAESQLAINEALYAQDLISFEEYTRRKVEIEKEAAEERLRKESEVAEGIAALANYSANIVRGIQDLSLQKAEAKYEKELELAGDDAEKRAQIEEQYEQEKKEIKKKYADIQFVMDIASIAANTSVAAMKAWSQGGMFAAPMVALIVAQGLVQVAQANQQRETVKNLWTGGYTGPGIWNEPKGIVHSDEFVGNREAVGNPAVNRVFSLIDHAQRNNYIGSLSSSDIIESLRGEKKKPGTRSETEGQAPAVTQTVIANNPELQETMTQLTKRLKDPIYAYTTVSGPLGADAAKKLYDKLNNNASR